MTTTLEIAEARRLDQRIRLLASQIGDSLTKLYGLVEQAKAGDIHLALGYPSWPAYIAEACKIQIKVDRHTRRELVGWLDEEGMSQRAIAATLGISKNTVTADLSQTGTPDAEVSGYFTDAAEAADSMAMADLDDEAFEAVLAEARAEGDLSRETVAAKCRDQQTTTGLDNKQYRKREPEARVRHRRPITEAFDSAAYDLTKVTKRIESLADDDRFAKNVERISGRRSDLIRARDALDRVIARMDEPHVPMGGER